ncbi:hypothetical protein VPH35_054329 [Triticum aestivum]
MDDLERRLQLAVVMYVGRARPLVSCEEAAVAIAEQLGIPRFRFPVHKFHPENFLVVFAAHQFRNMALAVPSIEHQGFKLFIKPWLRQAQATSRLMRVQIDVMIEGMASHAWSQSTAAEILGSACLIESLAPETASREDLSLFKLRAWCVDPEDVPVFHRLWVPEPLESRPDPAARMPSFRQLLEYPTLVHIGRMRDFSPLKLWRGRSGSDEGSGHSGLPDSSHEMPEVQIASGGASGGPGRSYRDVLEGRVGPSEWRLPHMADEKRDGHVGHRASFTTTTEKILRSSNTPRSQLGTLATGRATAGGRDASDPLATVGEEVAVPTSLAFAADQNRAAGQEQGTLVLVPGEIVGQVVSTIQEASGRVGPQVDVASVKKEAVGSARTAHVVVLEETLHARQDSVWTGSSQALLVLAGDQGLEPQRISGQQVAQEGHEQRSPNGWAPVEDLMQANAKELPREMTEVVPTSIVVAMQIEGGRDGTVDDMTTYATGTELEPFGVQISTGTTGLELQPGDANLSSKEQLAVSNIRAFCAGLLKKLPPPLLKEFEGLRGVRPGQDPFTPRRTIRSLGVGVPRKTKSSSTEAVLLKTLGFDCEDIVVSEDALGQLRQVFDSPLQEQQLQAIAAIFGKAIPFSLGGEMESTELAVA